MLSLTLDEQMLLYIAGAIILVFIIWIARLEIKLRRILGKGSSNFSETLNIIHARVRESKKFEDEMKNYLKTVEFRLRKSIQGVNTVRFNPFEGKGFGGKQSFATAFINEYGDGVVFSSIYGRDRVSVYSKPLVNFSSEFELTEEEKHAIEEARAYIGRK